MSDLKAGSETPTLAAVSPRTLENRHRAPWTKALAAELRAEMGAQDWTQKELAERAGVPAVSVQRYVSGEAIIGIPALAAMCEAFGMSVADFVARAEARVHH